MKRVVRVHALGIAMIALAGCDGLARFTGQGKNSFTFKGHLPAEFGIDATAFYTALQPDSAHCRAITLEPGKTVTRKYAFKYSADFKSEPQDFSFEIPLSHSKLLCAMRLGRVQLAIRGRHGDKEWQRSYDDGGLYVVQRPSNDTAVFGEDGVLSLTGTCRWTFQQSVARSYIDEIEKLLSCDGAGAYLALDEVNGKTVALNIEVSPEETPSERETWIKFPNGWKSCAHQGDWRWCREPITFRTFKMNGKTCTIYPGCTE